MAGNNLEWTNKLECDDKLEYLRTGDRWCIAKFLKFNDTIGKDFMDISIDAYRISVYKYSPNIAPYNTHLIEVKTLSPFPLPITLCSDSILYYSKYEDKSYVIRITKSGYIYLCSITNSNDIKMSKCDHIMTTLSSHYSLAIDNDNNNLFILNMNNKNLTTINLKTLKWNSNNYKFINTVLS
eukprot:533345_1